MFWKILPSGNGKSEFGWLYLCAFISNMMYFCRCSLTMTEETADEATDSLEGFLEDLPATRADLPAEVEVRVHVVSWVARNYALF